MPRRVPTMAIEMARASATPTASARSQRASARSQRAKRTSLRHKVAGKQGASKHEHPKSPASQHDPHSEDLANVRSLRDQEHEMDFFLTKVSHDHPIGITVQSRRSVVGVVTVTMVEPGSPAAITGLLVGDVLAQVNFRPCPGNAFQTTAAIKALPSGNIHLRIRRAQALAGTSVEETNSTVSANVSVDQTGTLGTIVESEASTRSDESSRALIDRHIDRPTGSVTSLEGQPSMSPASLDVTHNLSSTDPAALPLVDAALDLVDGRLRLSLQLRATKQPEEAPRTPRSIVKKKRKEPQKDSLCENGGNNVVSPAAKGRADAKVYLALSPSNFVSDPKALPCREPGGEVAVE